MALISDTRYKSPAASLFLSVTTLSFFELAAVTVKSSESESPYLEIRKYKKNHITIDNNKGSEKKSQESNTTKYIFYLPEETFDKILAKG